MHERGVKYKKGGVLIEFSIILPLFLMLLFGVFTVGYWASAQQVVTHAAYTGAMAGSLTNNNQAVQDAVFRVLSSLGVDKTSLTQEEIDAIVKIEPIDSSLRGRGSVLTVTVRYVIPFIFNDKISKNDNLRTVKASISTLIECSPTGGVYVLCE